MCVSIQYFFPLEMTSFQYMAANMLTSRAIQMRFDELFNVQARAVWIFSEQKEMISISTFDVF